MARKTRIQEAGATYHITTHEVTGLGILGKDPFRIYFLELLDEVATKYGWLVHSYCLMDTHYHMLVTTPEANIAAGMRDLNGRFARWFNRQQNRRGHVFEARYDGAPIRTDSHLLECIRYIALNPVRAGMCERPQDWPWSSYASLVGLARPPSFLVEEPVRRLFGPTRAVAIRRIRAFVEIAAHAEGKELRLAA